MPAPLLKKYSKEYGIPLSRLEKLWKKAKSLAKSSGREDSWGYITGILKKMIKAESINPETKSYISSHNINSPLYSSNHSKCHNMAEFIESLIDHTLLHGTESTLLKITTMVGK